MLEKENENRQMKSIQTHLRIYLREKNQEKQDAKKSKKLQTKQKIKKYRWQTKTKSILYFCET